MKKHSLTLFTLLLILSPNMVLSESLNDLVKRDSLFYKKYSDIPFRGIDVIAFRKRSMKVTENKMAKIKRNIRVFDYSQILLDAKSIRKWTNVMLNFFPKGSYASVDNSSAASDDIWENFQLFETFTNAKKDGLEKLIIAVGNKNKQKLVEAFAEVKNSCDACHERFRN